jgi:hypothetical protein
VLFSNTLVQRLHFLFPLSVLLKHRSLMGKGVGLGLDMIRSEDDAGRVGWESRWSEWITPEGGRSMSGVWWVDSALIRGGNTSRFNYWAVIHTPLHPSTQYTPLYTALTFCRV